MPEAPRLKEIRQEIDYNFEDFKKIIGSKKFKSVYGDLYRGSEYSLSRVPKGYEPDNPAASYLKLKCFIAEVGISDEDLISKNGQKKTLEAFSALQPLVEFFNAV
jgi:hypothetical protein